MFKRIIKRLSALLILGGICTAGAYYYLGYFDFSFIDRRYVLGDGLGDTQSIDYSPDTEQDSTDGSEEIDPEQLDDQYNQALMSAESGNLSEMTIDTAPLNSEETTAPQNTETPVPAESFFKKVTEYRILGYKQTDTIYNQATHVLGEVIPSVKLTQNYSNSFKNITYPVKDYPVEDGEYVISYENRRIKRPAVDLYMGYIFYDKGTEIYLLDADGNAVSQFDLKKYAPAYTRDLNGNPVFQTYTTVTDASGVTDYVKSYYILSEDKKSLIISDYNDVTDNRGIYWDYPSYYGKASSDQPERVYNEISGTWSYSGIWGSYLKAYNFVNGFACTANAKNEMSIMNEYGYNAFVTKENVRNAVNRNVYEIRLCVMPSSFGEETIGYFYYDHGLIRVREQRVESVAYNLRNKKTIMYDTEKLFKTDGTEFLIPFSYTIESYSNGVILLRKGEKYGYMDYTGAWIAQPVYTDATTFSEGLAVLTLSNGKMGMIDTKGNIVIPFQYDYISNSSSGIIAVYDESAGWHILQKMSK